MSCWIYCLLDTSGPSSGDAVEGDVTRGQQGVCVRLEESQPVFWLRSPPVISSLSASPPQGAAEFLEIAGLSLVLSLWNVSSLRTHMLVCLVHGCGRCSINVEWGNIRGWGQEARLQCRSQETLFGKGPSADIFNLWAILSLL